MRTLVRRILLVDPEGKDLDTRIEEICDIDLAAGFRLASSLILDGEVVLIFQSSEENRDNPANS